MEEQQNTNQDTPNLQSDRIKEEFYKWFESRGLLSDLRAYMRQLMVKALEDVNRNGKNSLPKKSSISPKLQAINLLVVDYLFHEDYLYTVSVFASEAQILESLPQYSRYIKETVRERHRDPSSLPRFSQQETEDILDTLRLPPTRQAARQAINLYLSEHESLLTCVVRTLASSHNQIYDSDAVEVCTQGSEECNYQLWSQEIQDLLLLGGVKLQHIRRMQQRWAQMVEEEKRKAKREAEDEYSEEKVEWQKTTELRIREEVVEGMRSEQQLLRERQSRVEMREQGLTSLAEQLTAVHDDISDRMAQLQVQSEDLQEREALQESNRVYLEERISQLHLREERLKDVVDLQESTVDASSHKTVDCGELEEATAEVKNRKLQVKTGEASVQVEIGEAVSEPRMAVSTQTLCSVEAVYTQTTDTADQQQQTSLDTQPDPQLLMQLQKDRDKINELQEENLELRAHALQQRHRIDELTNRAASLSNQLEESQVAVAVLSGRESAVIPVAPLPVPNHIPAFITPTFGFNTPQRQGAGEESLFTPRLQQAVPRPDGRRRPLRFAFSQHPSPTSEESSPTDEVIQNARARIQQLEEESALVQRNYQDFQNRILTSDSVMFPPLGNGRIHNPIMRVRRSEFAPFVPVSRFPYPSLVPNRVHQFQPRQPIICDEENEDSSSDQAPSHEVDGFENITHSRRMFTHRNIRQFERWKQFKKKFQRRDALDHNRRNLHVPHSNTSSEDDESNLRNTGRGFTEMNKIRKVEKSRLANSKNQNSNQPENKNKPCKPGRNQVQVNISSTRVMNEQVNRLDTQHLIPLTQVTREEALNSIAKPIIDERKEKLKLELDQSVKLIESVKILLEESKAKNPGTSTLSNNSLPIESLPKDSQSGSHNDLVKTDNSSVVLTVQSIKPVIQHESEKKTTTKLDTVVEQLFPKNPVNIDSHENNSQLLSNEITVVQSNEVFDCGRDDEREFLEETSPVPLMIPNLRLVSPGMNVTSEDLVQAGAVTLSVN